ncbi:proline iminopeptidase [Conidiobolus coronatus NRRL 28638]|uniref:Proline iminopeptidase n=1 Tax=Conidiobolus coronatus (strain ATCC 28846 / CBS 209.66 / NRRL 28638) TaxID=796925 RepID=A0A137NZR1_CONC2|nr:proline iminopeptidase [Conidiobolus coronatus NRRL 28638]|eukprot:KXN68295.1 proline iminopeptidase [Conidiobolus coronatus NRRL 28638]
MNNLYPKIEACKRGKLQVSDIHQLYYEESGNKHGLPVLFLHGGPGSGCYLSDHRFFDPKAYRIILLDQRSSGKSKPSASIIQNTTWDLVGDIEKLRKHLGIDKWVVFGGSWGACLALILAETHPTTVLALILRGVFTFREEEIRWLFQYGANFIYPDIWEIFKSPIPTEEHDDFVTAYHKRLSLNDDQKRLELAKAWSTWECAISCFKLNLSFINRFLTEKLCTALFRIECHYMANKGFLKSDAQIIDNASIIADHKIPVSIVQGRYDMVCPVKTAWDLKKKLGNVCDLHIVEGAGHAVESPIADKLVEFTNYYRDLFAKN